MKAKKYEKKFHPGTPFEQGPPDPKSNALPPELLRKWRFGQKNTSTKFKKRGDFL